MNYLKIEHEDVCNGSGLRCTIWFTSCSHMCKGCFNKETWDPDSGIPFDELAKQEIFNELSKNYISGITLSGGDPLHENNLSEVLSLVKEIRNLFPNKTIWLYTGYTWEEIRNAFGKSKEWLQSRWKDSAINRWEIISMCDVIVDGEYIDDQRDITLKWRGSSNQRVIDVQKSLEQGKVVLYCD
jgi:anaerobic ribonucleoside-triphosphate reductase activating protein